MWANIAVAVLGVAALGTVVTVGMFYGNEIGQDSIFSSIVNGLKGLAEISELELVSDEEPKDLLSENEKNYTPYSTSGGSSQDISFGVKYGKLLVSDTDATWWNNNVDARKDSIDDSKSQIFKGIKSKSDVPSFAKEKCKEAYGKKISDVEKEEDVSNIWMLCSPIRSKPLSVSTLRSKYQGKLASESTHAPYFLEDRAKNKYAWEMLYEKFVKESKEDKSDEFKFVDKGYSSEENKALNKVCAEAYSDDVNKLNESGKEKYKKNVLKFCTFTNLDLTTTQ